VSIRELASFNQQWSEYLKTAKDYTICADKRNAMPKEKVLYVCDEKHNNRDIPLELEETIPYPENIQYGERDSVHYYYQCPFCFKTYLAYQRVGKPWEWSVLDKEVWEKRITNVRESRVNALRKDLDEQKNEIERRYNEAHKLLKEIVKRKEELTKEIEEKNALLEQLTKDEQELTTKIEKQTKELHSINERIEKITMI
jgi:DNA repair exonuclease SbcCD ATPase subunit